MDFTVTYRLEQKDYYSFNLHHSKLRLLLIPIVFILVISVAFLWSLLSAAPNETPTSLPSIYIVYIIAIIVVLPFINILMIRGIAAKQYRSVMHKDITLQLDEEGLKYSGSFGESRLPWTAVHRVSESSAGAYFYFSAAQAVIIPKRAMSHAQYETLRTLCRKHLTPKKCRLK